MAPEIVFLDRSVEVEADAEISGVKCMRKNNRSSSPSGELRDKAEDTLRRKPEGPAPPGEEDPKRILHELQIHQIELEMQNEELRRTQGELEASRARYFELYDLAPVGYLILTDTVVIQEANLTAAALIGVERSLLTKQPMTRFVDREDQDLYYWHHKLLFETGAPQACELRLATKNGGRRWTRIEAAVGQDDDEAPVCRVAMTDITERKRAEAFVQIRLRLFEFAATHSLADLLQKTVDEADALTDSPVGFYHFVDPDQKSLTLQAWSTRTVAEFCKAEGKGLHYGLDQAGVWTDCVHQRRPVIHNDYASLPHKKGMPPGHAPVIRELVVPIMRKGGIVAILGVGNKPADYTESDVEAVSFIADVAWTIIERKRVEDALRTKEQAVRGSINAIILTDLDGRITYFNPSFAKMWNVEREEDVVGKHTTEFFADLEKFRAGSAAFRHDGFFVGELTAVRQDRTEFAVQASASTVKDDSGATIAFTGAFVDITERKLIEKTQLFLLRRGYSQEGEDFFQSLARHLAETLAVDIVCIDRLAADGLSADTVALFQDGGFRDNVNYALADTPCGEVVGKSICSFPRGVRELFPKDAGLQRLSLESYIGTTLWDITGKPIGLIALVSRQPRESTRVAETILQLLAPRAAGELERRKAEEALKDANAVLEDRVRERTVELEKRAEQLSALAFDLTRAEIRERKRLAQFLHDDLQQLLVCTKFSVSAAKKNSENATALTSLDQATEMLDQSIAASRTLTSEIAPPILNDGDLAGLLGWISRWTWEKHGLTVDLRIEDDVNAKYEVRVLLFQVVRELLFNVVKHAGVDRAELLLTRRQPGELLVVVSDKGKGFEPGLAGRHERTTGGFGLFSIHERLQWIGGRCEIASAPGGGTTVSLFAPIA
jgi:PAS domain S-box-containing protein